VLPIAIIAVALAFLLLPAGKVASKPMEQFAENVRRTIYDYLFFTEPRNVFSLSAEGYYPEGSSQLGGPATPLDHLVMTVQTPKNTLLRGAIKDEYNGRMWKDTTGGRRYLYISPRWRSLRDTLLDASLPNVNLNGASTILAPQTVSVTMQIASASTLFTPQRIKDLSTKSDMVVYFNNASELFITRDLKPEDSYTIEASLIQGGDPGLNTLVNAAQETPDANYAGLAEKYLALPGHLEQLVFDKAQLITENYQTPYDKALAIKTYLSRYYRYTLDAEAPPKNIDFVTYFLFKSKEGYCTYFATAMTVLCRMVGIPARYVEGYLAQPNESGTARVTGLNAHAWTEVYFSGFGWVSFDATPPQQQENTPPDESQPPEPSPSPEPQNTPEPTPTTTPAPQENTPQPSDTPETHPTPTPEPTEEPPPENETPPNEPPPKKPFPWWILLALAVTAGTYLRLRMTTPAFKARRAKNEKDAMNAYISGVYDLLLLDKQWPAPAESPLAFAARLDGLNRYPHPLLPMAEALCLSQYSRHPVQEGDVVVTKETFDSLYSPRNILGKMRFRVYRAFFRKKSKK
jgi:transglutaminase-like putative cysteine protease